MAIQDDELVGTVGVEAVEFETSAGERFRVGFGHNFFSFVPGVGARLYFRAVRTYGGGVSFGAVPRSQQIMKKRRWTMLADVYEWSVNPLDKSDQLEPAWKAAARSLRAQLLRVDLRTLASRATAAGFSACQVQRLSKYSPWISPDQTEFSWRFRPSLEHLKWRYPLKDGPLRYRAYQVERAGEPLGFVILSWRPDQIAVAHVDVARRADYVPAVVHSIAALVEENDEARYAWVRFAKQQDGEDALLRTAGFRRAGWPTFFGVSQQSDADRVEIPLTGGNFSLGIGDNDLRVPFWEDVPGWPHSNDLRRPDGLTMQPTLVANGSRERPRPTYPPTEAA
jgi:hypothetical protein